MTKIKKILKATSITIIILFLTFASCLILYSKMPNKNHKKDAIIEIPFNKSFNTIITQLYQADIIKYPILFKIYSYIYKYPPCVKSGEYLFEKNISPNKILEKLCNCQVILHKVCIPEGFNIYQIVTILEKNNLEAKKDFISKAMDKDFIKELKLPKEAESVEGFLFPETYYFPKQISASDLIKIMVEKFKEEISQNFKNDIKKQNLSLYEIITIASIIEKETAKDYERKLISSVIHNRLKKNMRLELDPTVIYGMKNFDGNIKKNDLKNKNPYNTYQIKGLPIGPIANPSLSSIESAIFPANTKFLYFVAKENGTHQFSKNIKDHNKAVRKHILKVYKKKKK